MVFLFKVFLCFCLRFSYVFQGFPMLLFKALLCLFKMFLCFVKVFQGVPMCVKVLLCVFKVFLCYC